MEQVSYKKLFKLLIDKDLKKTEFAVKAGISQNTLARMGKGQFISMELLVRICRYLNCTFDDVVEIIDKENQGENEMFDSIKIKSIYRTKNDDFDEINLLNVSSEVAMNTITAELKKIIEKQLNDESDILTMDLITNLIAANRIEVKIAYLPNGGLYHEKIGYLEDFEENKVCFIGSNNETHSGQKRNAETISIIKSWDGGEEDTIGEKQYFENLWENKEKEIEVVNFPTAAKNKLFSIYRKSSSYEESIKRIEEYYERLIIDSGKKELYKYQERA